MTPGAPNSPGNGGALPQVLVAKHAGFCFGVRRATDALERELAEGGRTVCTLGRLIHNDVYNASLDARGVRCISADDLDAIFAECERGAAYTVVVRAHGELDGVIRRMKDAAGRFETFRFLDCTCPYVDKVRRIAGENSGEGRLFFLLGAADHPEVRGIMSCVRGEGHVFADANELERFIGENEAKIRENTVCFAAQTTQKLSEWKKSLKILEKLYTKAIIFDTICNVTAQRQTEARALAAASDAVIVIGSASSSNTVKLYEVCRSVCENTYLVGDANEIDPTVFAPYKKLSITAGASTPISVIREVERKMSENTENFEELLEQHDSVKTIKSGDVVTGIVSSISPNEIHMDLGTKATGVVTKDQITDDPNAKLNEMFKIGDEFDVFVIKVSDIDGIATLSKKRVDSDKNWKDVAAAYESGEVLEGKIVEAVKGGVIISVKSNRVFIPASQTGVPRDGDLSVLVGSTQRIKIIEVRADRRRAYGSIRAVAREERKAKEKAFWETVEEGMIYEGPVKSLTSYGAFVDLGGVDGMVHMSELSWTHIKHPSEVVKVGDMIKVFVKAIDRERKRISLGYKTEDTDPWFILNNKYKVGDVASVKIVSLMPFGAFAEVVPGADGLIHISQITDHKIDKPGDVLEIGQVVTAKITAIDQENRKISLSIRALMDPTVDLAPADGEADEEAPEAPAEEAPAEEAPAAPAEEAPAAPAEEAPAAPAEEAPAAPAEEAPAEEPAPADAE